MKKEKTKGKTSRRYLDLYKIFKKDPVRPSVNVGPWAFNSYFGQGGYYKYEAMKATCPGFVVQKVREPLDFCSAGYHAFPAHARDYYLFGKAHYKRFRLYKVRLYNCKVRDLGRDNEKWVGTHFKVLQRVTFDLKPRRFKD